MYIYIYIFRYFITNVKIYKIFKYIFSLDKNIFSFSFFRLIIYLHYYITVAEETLSYNIINSIDKILIWSKLTSFLVSVYPHF